MAVAVRVTSGSSPSPSLVVAAGSASVRLALALTPWSPCSPSIASSSSVSSSLALASATVASSAVVLLEVLQEGLCSSINLEDRECLLVVLAHYSSLNSAASTLEARYIQRGRTLEVVVLSDNKGRNEMKGRESRCCVDGEIGPGPW
jgi:hypothetical protein